MKTRLVNVRKPRGARIAKLRIKVVRSAEGVATTDAVRAHHPRAGWAERAATVTTSLLDSATSTRFDEDEWRW